MQRLAIAFLICSTACAGNNPTPGAAPVQQTIAITGGGPGGMSYVPSSGMSNHTFAFPIDRVWAVMPAVLDSLSIPVSLLDEPTHTIGNRGFKLRGRLGKTPLSRFIDCGTTQIGPNAESYDVTLTFTAALSPAPGGGTAIALNFESSARPPAFSQEPFRCSTRNQLEPRFLDLTTRLLSR